MKETIEVGIEEEPYRFKYTRYMMKLIEELDMKVSDISGSIYERVIDEMTRYLI